MSDNVPSFCQWEQCLNGQLPLASLCCDFYGVSLLAWCNVHSHLARIRSKLDVCKLGAAGDLKIVKFKRLNKNWKKKYWTQLIQVCNLYIRNKKNRTGIIIPMSI